MTALHHLRTQLTTLQLSGRLETLEQRIAQAEGEHLGYLDLLECLLEDEVQRRGRTSLAARIARAHVETVKCHSPRALSQCRGQIAI